MAGNATVTLSNGSSFTTYELWIQSITTATSNEFSNQQLRDTMAWIPIRRAEMNVSFTVAWPLTNSNQYATQLGFENIDPSDGFAMMNAFQDAIRVHQLAMVNGSTNSPMIFTYENNSDPSSPIYNTIISNTPLKPLTYNGWIRQSQKQYIKFQNVFITNYNMNIITPNVANTPLTSANVSLIYPPTASDQGQFGSNWVNIAGLATNASQILGLPG